MKEYEISQQGSMIAAEPVVAYGSNNYFEIANSLISKDYIKQVLSSTRISLTELIDIIPISIDTYKRKTSFNPSVSEKVLEIEEVYSKGGSAFGDGFHHWMNTNNIALGGIVPKILLSNSFGIRRLLDEIGRMEYGVLS